MVTYSSSSFQYSSLQKLNHLLEGRRWLTSDTYVNQTSKEAAHMWGKRLCEDRYLSEGIQKLSIQDLNPCFFHSLQVTK